jgi:hypothetical protein
LDDSHTWLGAQAAPHAPQFSGSAVVSTQLWLHVVYGGLVQVATQAPAWQNGVPPLHAVPHEPQLLGSLATSVHWPLHSCDSSGQAHVP